MSFGRLENQPQTELDMPRPARTEHSVARIRSRVGVAEFSGYSPGWVTAGISDRGVIDEIEKFRPELGAISLSEMPGLGDRHVDILERRAPKTVAACVTVRSVGGRRQNTSVLDVARVICERLKSERLQCGVAGVRSLCCCGTGLLYSDGRGGKGRAARLLAVTGNRVLVRGECGPGTAEIPELDVPAVVRIERVEIFTSSDPIIPGGIHGAPGQAALESQNAADRPAFKHLSG
jgi:hypothetical protein